MADLLYWVVRPDPRTEAALTFIFGALGIRAAAASPPELWERAHLVYGDGAPTRPNGIAIPEHPGDVLWLELLADRVDPSSLGGQVSFDIVGAIAAMLDDGIHRDVPQTAFDHHDRLNYAASVPAQAGLGDRPIVNVYLAFLDKLLHERLGVVGRARWPDGRAAAIGLSHDVDNPDRYALLASALRPWRLRRSPRTYVRRALQLARARARDPHPRDFWLFDQVAGSESGRGFRSTFFFAAVPFHARWGAAEDVAYDVAEPAFRRTIRSLQQAGFEVGLHASYRAFEDASHLATERNRLGDVAEADISGVRHHYWHLGRDVAATLRAHERAGFRYDSSLAFNDHVGFRRSVALPFQPYDPVLERPLRIVELPPFCMDGNLFYTSSSVDAAVATVAGLIDEIVRTGGMGAIDWHIQTSHPSNREFRAWGTAYQEILSLLAGRPDVWTTDLGSIARWATARADPAVVAAATASPATQLQPAR